MQRLGSAPVGVSAIDWGWRHSTRRAWTMRGVDLHLEPGERVLLLGPSGAGKSTLLAAMAGLLEPFDGSGSTGTGEQEGQLCLDGIPARRARFEALTAGQARTGLVLQDPQAQTMMARCGDDVAFGLENHGVPTEQIWPRTAAALAAVGLRFPLEHSTAYLSGGQRQRLALAGVLALRPGLLLLDEPTAQLDPDGARDLRDHVADVLDTTGATCIVVEHRVDLWLDVVDRIVILEPGGGVWADGAPGEVLSANADLLAAEGIWLPRTGASGLVAGVVAGLSRPPRRVGDTAQTLLQARDLAVTRTRGGPQVVTGVSLDVEAGTFTALTGPNGSGKSSVALALGGLIAPSGGTLTACSALRPPRNRPPHQWRPDQLVTRIGSVFQNPAVQFVTSSCAAELAVGPQRAGVPAAQIDARVEELLDRLRLTPLAAANPFTLSGGEQRRLSVATALAARPPVLVLDEPTFGQDSRTWTELVQLLDGLRANGTAVVAATHDQLLLEVLADDVLSMDSGRMVAGELWPAAPPW